LIRYKFHLVEQFENYISGGVTPPGRPSKSVRLIVSQTPLSYIGSFNSLSQAVQKGPFWANILGWNVLHEASKIICKQHPKV